MAATVNRWTGRDATVIDDPYENEELPPQCAGREVLWLDDAANLPSLLDVFPRLSDLKKIVLTICTNYPHQNMLRWSPDVERRSLARCAVVLVTGNNRGASANRIVKALRAGRKPALTQTKPHRCGVNCRD